jgi:hypothetical protein
MSMREYCPAEVNTITQLVLKASYHFCFTTARAVDRRANEPQQTFVSSLRQPTIHEGAASRQRKSV